MPTDTAPRQDDAILIDPCLARLEAAIDAARVLGVPVGEAEAVRTEAGARLGFPADVSVVALVGGTGVGKSSLLNALAGEEVSPASVRRPTTAAPVAWVPSGAETDLEPLMDWLGVTPADIRVARPDGAVRGSGAVAILDLPDLDSIAPEHRRRVDVALPRVDAVIWVTDPEKYHDAVLHDEMLARWLPRLGRQLVVVNKADRLSAADGERLRRDLERDIERLAPAGGQARGGERPSVVLASTRVDGDGPGPGFAAVRDWLVAGAEAKPVIRARLLATIRDAIASLARGAGLDPTVAVTPLLASDVRRAALNGASDALLRVVDLPALRHQAIGATRARARARGAGPLGGLTARLFRWSGRQARVADPAAYLARWRDRGSPGPAAGVLRAALAEPLRVAPPGMRQRIAAGSEAAGLEGALGAAVERAIATDPGEPPTSRWWTIIGLAQTVATGAIVLSVAWVILWILIRFAADDVVVPLIGRVPMPFVVLVGSLLAGYLLARILGAHASWLGRRWAGRLAERIRDHVTTEVTRAAFAPLDGLEAGRRALWSAARGLGGDGSAGRDCAASERPVE